MTTTTTLVTYPAAGGGKYHALRSPAHETAACNATILLDVTASPIHVQPGQARVHPIVCRRCLTKGESA